MSDLWRYTSVRSDINVVSGIGVGVRNDFDVLAKLIELVLRAVVEGEGIPGTVPGSCTTLFRNASSARLTMRKTVRTQADMVGSVSITGNTKGRNPHTHNTTTETTHPPGQTTV